MSNTVTPSFTDNVAVVAAATLARGSTARGTLDLRAKFGAYLFPRIGRGGTTALTNGIDVLVRRVANNDGADGQHPAGAPAMLSSTAAASSTTCATSDSNSGQPALNVSSITGFAAGDIICIWDSGNTTFSRLEFHRVSKTATGILTLDRNLHYTHTSAGVDTVRNKADVFAPIWIPGGSLWEVVFDYGDDSAGDTAVVQCMAQTYDSDTIV